MWVIKMYTMTAKLRVNNKTISIDIIGETFEQMIKNAKKKIRNMRDCCFDIITEQSYIYEGEHYNSLSILQNRYITPFIDMIRNQPIYIPNYYINTTSNSTYSMLYSTTDNSSWR